MRKLVACPPGTSLASRRVTSKGWRSRLPCSSRVLAAVIPAMPAPTITIFLAMRAGRLSLLDRDRLRAVARLVDVVALQVGDVLGDELAREHREQGQEVVGDAGQP